MVRHMRCFCLLLIFTFFTGTSNAVFAALWGDDQKQEASGDVEDFSVFDLVTECDILAAHPDDPQRMAEGVADDEIVPRLAIMACEDALEQDADEPRFAFQIARALLAVGRENEAYNYFVKAAETDYPAAEAYLGDYFQFGLGDVKQDAAQALAKYKKAVAGEFKIAESQIEQLTFNPSAYVTPAAKYFFAREFSQIKTESDLSSQGGRLFRNYVFNLVLPIIEECDDVLKPTNLANFYLYRYPAGWNQEQDENIHIAIQTSIGEFDAQVFLDRHGCDGPVAKQFFENLNAYFGS